MLQMPTIQDIQESRNAFEANEPRDLFYRAATEPVSFALEGKTSWSVAEALAVLLQTWNKMFYQYRRFDHGHFADIERLVGDHSPLLIAFRQRTIESFSKSDESTVRQIFAAFQEILGPVGAAKCLQLLADRWSALPRGNPCGHDRACPSKEG